MDSIDIPSPWHCKASNAKFSVVDSLDCVRPAEWNALKPGAPLLSHEYLRGLEATACATATQGWQPRHLLLRREGRLQAAMPLYLKSHSLGEYVFDQAWAQAHAQHGLAYYPRLVAAVPFSPVPGPRLLAGDDHDRHLLVQAALALARHDGVSSLHVLFPEAADAQILHRHGLLSRLGIQFRWTNRGYSDGEHFLAGLKQRYRKKIRQERRQLAAHGIQFRICEGDVLSADDMDFIIRCYRNTYLERGRRPYLSAAFFHHLRRQMASRLVAVLALQHGEPVAAALNLRDDRRLFGRWWGCTRFVPGLHFETCYLQGIEYCIREGLAVFEGGAQGGHKLARGLLPAITTSAHWIADERFARAIKAWLVEETAWVNAAMKDLLTHSPYLSSLSTPGGMKGNDENI